MRDWLPTPARFIAIAVTQTIGWWFGLDWWQVILVSTPAYWAGLCDKVAELQETKEGQ